MLSSAERNSLLRQCWQRGQWADGLDVIARPVRSSLYKIRKKMLGNGSHRLDVVAPSPVPPSIDAEIHPVFCDRVPDFSKAPFPASLMDDVREIEQGRYPLAGGVFHPVDSSALEKLPELEDWHAYHRLYWAVRLSQAVCAHVPAAKTLLDTRFSQWLNTDWRCDPVVFQPYTVSERIASFSEILSWSKTSALSIKQRIWEDASRLYERIEYGLGVHNHLLNNARALFLAAAALPECQDASKWRDKAFQIWEEYGPQLILEDGTFGEQSSHYHLLLCRTALEYWLAGARFGRGIPVSLQESIRLMFRLANDLLRPGGSLPRFGDVSPDRGVEQLRGLMVAAHFHGILDEAPRERCITPLTFLYCGEAPCLPEQAESAPARVYPAGGFGFLRSEVHGAELVVHSDPRPDVYAHGDAGRGSFELSWGGHILIREPGSFLSPSNPDRLLLRSGQAQNVTCLNGLAPGVTPEDRRFVPRWYLPNGGALRLQGDELHLRCDGFQRLRSGIVLFRTWRFDEAGALLFEERIEGRGDVEFESRICLGDLPWRPVASDANRIRWQDAQMSVEPPQGVIARIEPCKFVVEYGLQKAGLVWSLTGNERLPLQWRMKCEFTKEGLN